MTQSVDVSQPLVRIGTMSAWACHSNPAPYLEEINHPTGSNLMNRRMIHLDEFSSCLSFRTSYSNVKWGYRVFNSPKQDTCVSWHIVFSKGDVVSTRWWDSVILSHITVTRKHQRDSNRTVYEFQLRDNSLQDILSQWAIIPSGFRKTIITMIIWFFVPIDRIYGSKSQYIGVFLLTFIPRYSLWKFGVYSPQIYALCI